MTSVRHRNGYPAVAEWIARDPDSETYIFRKFDELSARNLLHLQSQVISLESRLKRLNEVWQADDGLRSSLVSWDVLEAKADQGNAAEKGRMELVEKIQEKLKEYHEALLRQAQLAALDRPNPRVLSAFRNWFKGGAAHKDTPYRVLAGSAQYMLEDEDGLPREDLAALRTLPDQDLLSRWLRKYWPVRTQPSPDPRENVRYFRDRYVRRTVTVLNVLAAAVVLVGPIVGLYFETRPAARLGMIGGFTVLFTSSVWLLTNARRAELFAATATYAAVLVVFVSGDLGQTNHPPSANPSGLAAENP